MASIHAVNARTILDSRGEWTVEIELALDSGEKAIASVPQGRSTGTYEAHFVKASNAVAHVNKSIASYLLGKDPHHQKEIDQFLIELDGTKDKSHLGANAILGVSLACARAASIAEKQPLWKYLSKMYGEKPKKRPRLFMNLINGGLHAGNNLQFQEYLVIPKEGPFTNVIDTGVLIYQSMKQYLIKHIGASSSNLGDEGGCAPIFRDEFQPFEIISEIINELKLTGSVDFGIDAAANNVHTNSQQLREIYKKMRTAFPIMYIEDPFSENDLVDFSVLENEIGKNTIIAGDDLTTTNVKRMQQAYEKNCINGMIVKPNQIGTLSETLSAIKKAREWDWKVILSHRSGETNDDFIVDLAYAVGADGVKIGAPARGERIQKYNRLLEIERYEI